MLHLKLAPSSRHSGGLLRAAARGAVPVALGVLGTVALLTVTACKRTLSSTPAGSGRATTAPVGPAAAEAATPAGGAGATPAVRDTPTTPAPATPAAAPTPAAPRAAPTAAGATAPSAAAGPVVESAPAGSLTEEQAEDLLLRLPELKAWSNYIRRKTKGTAHSYVMAQPDEPIRHEGKLYWSIGFFEDIEAGYHRWQQFLVRIDGKEILIDDYLNDRIMTLKQWRKQERPMDRIRPRRLRPQG
jgi:hypothetical protein